MNADVLESSPGPGCFESGTARIVVGDSRGCCKHRQASSQVLKEAFQHGGEFLAVTGQVLFLQAPVFESMQAPKGPRLELPPAGRVMSDREDRWRSLPGESLPRQRSDQCDELTQRWEMKFNFWMASFAKRKMRCTGDLYSNSGSICRSFRG